MEPSMLTETEWCTPVLVANLENIHQNYDIILKEDV